MSAPLAPALTQPLASVYPTDGAIDFYVVTSPNATAVGVSIYDDLSNLVYEGHATLESNGGGTSTWKLTGVLVSWFGTAGETYNVVLSAGNTDGVTYTNAGYFTVYDRPQVTLVPDEGDAITMLPLTVLWSITDPTGVSAQLLRIKSNDSSYFVYATDYTPALALGVDERSRTIDVADQLQPFVNGDSYAIVLRVTNGVGFTTTVTHNVTVSWAAPDPPTATVTIDDSAMTCDVTLHAPSTAPAVVSMTLVRVAPDGARYLIADGLTDGETVTDVLPPLGAEFSYEVTGITATGIPSGPALVQTTVRTSCWALNFGADAEELVTLRYNPSASYSLEHGGALYHFADGGAGGGLPVYYSTTDRDESGSISWQTADRALADRLRVLSLAHPIGWIRDPFGHRWRAHVMPSMSHERTRVRKVSIDWDKVRWEEP